MSLALGGADSCHNEVENIPHTRDWPAASNASGAAVPCRRAHRVVKPLGGSGLRCQRGPRMMHWRMASCIVLQKVVSVLDGRARPGPRASLAQMLDSLRCRIRKRPAGLGCSLKRRARCVGPASVSYRRCPFPSSMQRSPASAINYPARPLTGTALFAVLPGNPSVPAVRWAG